MKNVNEKGKYYTECRMLNIQSRKRAKADIEGKIKD